MARGSHPGQWENFPTQVRGKDFPTQVHGKDFPTQVPGKDFPTDVRRNCILSIILHPAVTIFMQTTGVEFGNDVYLTLKCLIYKSQ